MDSLWVGTAKRPKFQMLTEDINTDTLIIGGGMAGLLCAHMLRQAGVSCVLVEADRICSGITRNTTAKITMQHGLIYAKMLQRFGWEKTYLYAQIQKKALDEYRRLSRDIPCDFEEQDSFVYSLTDRYKLEQETAALEQIHWEAALQDQLPLPFPTAGGVCIPHQAQFHPLKFAFSLAESLPIYEHTKVTQWLPGGVVTNHGKIRAEHIIVATHFPLFNKHGAYFLKMYQHRSYVLALQDVPPLQGMYVDEADKGLSFRSYGDCLLLGGGSHRTGKHGGGWHELEQFSQQHYPAAREVGRWATQDCMTLDGLPYIGQYSARTQNVFVATGFHKWGMTSAMASAMILTDLVQGKRNDYEAVFSPSRSMLRPQLLINTAESLVGLLTPTTPRCPHMGCALKYNRQEHSWDCSCHGSRFSQDGELLDNPATDDL